MIRVSLNIRKSFLDKQYAFTYQLFALYVNFIGHITLSLISPRVFAYVIQSIVFVRFLFNVSNTWESNDLLPSVKNQLQANDLLNTKDRG